VKKQILSGLIAISVVAAMGVVLGSSTAKAQRQPQSQTAEVFDFVPASDGVVVVDVKRLMNETLPRVFAGDATKLAQVNSELDKFKAQTGIDARQFDRAVVAARYVHPTPNVTKLEPVAIATGTFKATAVVSASRLAAKGPVREEKYRGTTVTILTINDNLKVFGLWDMRVRDLAVAALSPNTVAVGTLATVRAAIDAGRTPRRDSVELIGLATRDPQAVVGFGANVPQAVWTGLNLGTDAIAQDAGSIRQAYGSVGTTATDVSLALIARTEAPANAKSLGDTLNGLKQIAFFAIMNMSGGQRALAENALANLTINSRANEVEVRTKVAAASLASLMK
jgi:hypothetical protein